jgi:hypothetical protein
MERGLGSRRGARPIDSSDEEADDAIGAAGGATSRARERQPKPPFSKLHTLHAVLGYAGCADSVAAHFSHSGVLQNTEAREAWHAWHTSAAEKLSELPAPSRALPLTMPMKCTAAAGPALENARGPKPELITYNNPGGRTFTKEQRTREAASMAKALTKADVPVGSCVGVKREPADPMEPPGYGTPFYVAEIMSVNLSESDDVSNLTVQWRMPKFNGLFCDDITRPLGLACVALHEWSPSCEASAACKRKRAVGAETSRFIAVLDPEMVFETNLKLTPATHALTKKTKELLAESNSEWRAALGVPRS